MAPPQAALKTTFEPSKVVQPFFSGGPGNVAVDETGRFLATVCEDEVVITDMETGQEMVRIEGVCCAFPLRPEVSDVVLTAILRRTAKTSQRSP